MNKTEKQGENETNEISNNSRLEELKMKKIICILFTVSIIFALTVQTLAIRNEPLRATARIYAPSTCSCRRPAVELPTVIQYAPLKKQETEICFTNSNLTVVDNKQVSVKYDIWLVKLLKKLFFAD